MEEPKTLSIEITEENGKTKSRIKINGFLQREVLGMLDLIHYGLLKEPEMLEDE